MQRAHLCPALAYVRALLCVRSVSNRTRMNHAACATSDSVVTVVAKQRLGHTALHYAIAWNNEAFVDFMLKQPGIELGLHNEVCVRVCVTARVCVCV